MIFSSLSLGSRSTSQFHAGVLHIFWQSLITADSYARSTMVASSNSPKGVKLLTNSSFQLGLLMNSPFCVFYFEKLYIVYEGFPMGGSPARM